MGSLLAVLSGIVNLQLLVPSNTLKFASTEAIVSELFGLYCAPTRLAHLQQALAQVTRGDMQELLSLAPELTQLDQDVHLDTKLAVAVEALDAVSALSALFAEERVSTARIVTMGLPLFRYLSYLSLPVGHDGIALTLVGQLLSGEPEVRVPMPEQRLLRLIKIAYTAESPFPLLTLRIGSGGPAPERKEERIGWKPERDNWCQRPSKTHDLTLRRMGVSGSIATRLLPLPQQIGPRQELTIASHPDVILIETIVSDGDGSGLLRCIRAYPTSAMPS